MQLPTDKLSKFFAVLGLSIISVSFLAIWPSYEDIDNKHAELIVKMQAMNDAYSKMAQGVNDQVAVFNSVQGDGSKLDAVHWKYLEQREKETKPFAEKANKLAEELAIPINQFDHQYKRFVFKAWVFGVLGCVGALFFLGGVYSWWKNENRPKRGFFY